MRKAAVKIIEKLNQNGYSAYLVGGCVRDLILGATPHDYDICTNALPEEIEKMFDRTVPTGKAFGTMTIILDENAYEVTTFRENEIYSGQHRPSELRFNTEKDGICKDLARRDFTINAIAYDPITEETIDPFGGMDDIRAKVIRCVGDADRRFTEDPLRMLRACRFACSTGFGFNISKETAESIQRNARLISCISPERIYQEMKKMVVSAIPENIMLLYYTGLADEFFPEFSIACQTTQNNKYHKASVGLHTVLTMKGVQSDPLLRFAALFHDLGKPIVKSRDHRGEHFYGHERESARIADEIMEKWRFPKKDMKIIHDIVERHDYFGGIDFCDANRHRKNSAKIKHVMNECGIETTKMIIQYCEADLYAHSDLSISLRSKQIDALKDIFYKEIIFDGQPYRISDLAVNGNDIPYDGRMVGLVLGYMLNDVIMYPEHNTREYLLSHMSEYEHSAKQKIRSETC